MEKPVTGLNVVCATAASRRALLSELFKLGTYVWHRGDEAFANVASVDCEYPHCAWPVVVINRHRLSLCGRDGHTPVPTKWPGDRERILEWAATPITEWGRFDCWPIIVAREGVKVGCTELSDEDFDKLQHEVDEFSSGSATGERSVRVHGYRLYIDETGIRRAQGTGNSMTFDAFDDLVKARENARDVFNPQG